MAAQRSISLGRIFAAEPMYILAESLRPLTMGCATSTIRIVAERIPHDPSLLGFLAGQIGRLITISPTPLIAGDSCEMDAVVALRLSPLLRRLSYASTVNIRNFYV